MLSIKKRLTNIIVTIAILFVVIEYNPLANAEDKTDSSGFKNEKSVSFPTPGEITIVASTPIPPSQKYSREAYEDILDCGFNLIFQETSIAGSSSVINLVSGLDLKIMWSNPGIRGVDCVETAKQFGDGAEFVGWQFVDEPRYENLTNLQIYYDRVKKLLPDKLIYINLIGANYKQFCGDCKDYTSYLDVIEKLFKPDVWSYDVYPFYIRNGKVTASLDLFYSDMEIFSNVSNKTGRPFWAYCQSMAFKNKDVQRPEATLPYLRFEAISALAYGAQGIVYWTYGQRKDTANEQYLSALVNLNGSKSPAWYAAKQVNDEIKAFNEVFYKSQLVDCKHTGDKLYDGTKKLSGSFGPLSHITSGSAGVLVSHLRTNGKDYLIVVSHDPFNSQTIRLNFNNKYNVNELVPVVGKDGNSLQKISVSGSAKKKFEAGGYAIYEWE